MVVYVGAKSRLNLPTLSRVQFGIFSKFDQSKVQAIQIFSPKNSLCAFKPKLCFHFPMSLLIMEGNDELLVVILGTGE